MDLQSLQSIVEQANAAALGLNTMSVAPAAEAILRAVQSDAPAATDGFRLTQEAGAQTGVVIYRALYKPGLPASTSSNRSICDGA